MYNEIQRWLQNPDYATGVALYEQYGKSAALKILFRAGTNSVSRPKLKQALTELAADAARPLFSTAAKPIVSEKSVRPSQLPDAPEPVKALVNSRREKYDEMRVLHARLKHFATNEERYQAAKRINDLEAEIWAIWEQTNYYDENLKLPEPAKPKAIEAESDRATLQRKLTNLRSYISKHKKKPEREADVLAWQAELREVEALLAQTQA